MGGVVKYQHILATSSLFLSALKEVLTVFT